MTDNFYRAFEEKYRGSRDVIKSRLTVYHPFLQQVLDFYPEAHALDLGCGRGEWLEYITSLGFTATGVDVDEGMLLGCEELGLEVEKAELLEHLKTLASESLMMISAFHVVEHITFDALRELVKEAFRVLKPGGLLLMETPNPENITTATCHFYLDPTHRNPIPCQLLSFVAENGGFERVKTLRLQERKDLVEKQDVSLRDVLSGVSPDYSVVAQKASNSRFYKEFSFLFDKRYGLSLDELLGRWDQKALRIQERVAQAEQTEVDILLRVEEAILKANEAAGMVTAMQNSISWKATVPLRLSGNVLKKIIKIHPCNHHSRVLRNFVLFFLKRPLLKKYILPVLNRFPNIKARLVVVSQSPVVRRDVSRPQTPRKMANLTPRAKKIYEDMKSSIRYKRED